MPWPHLIQTREKIFNGIGPFDRDILKDLESGESFSGKVWLPSFPIIVLGRFSSVQDVKPDVLAKEIPIVRRMGGGGTVLLGNQTPVVEFGFVEKDRHPIKYYACAIAEILIHNFRKRGVPVDFDESWYDYTIYDRKVGGSTFYVMKNRIVYGAVFIHKASIIGLIEEMLDIPGKQPEYRRNRSHKEFLTALEYFGLDLEDVLEILENSMNTFKNIILGRKNRGRDKTSQV